MTITKYIEIILINDGSTDESEKICKQYILNHNNIKYHYQDNQGVSVARNKGINLATGDYIYFLDSDDFIDKYFIKNAIITAKKNKAKLVYVATNIFNRKSPIISLGTCELFVQKEFLNEYPNVRFPEGFQHLEDNIFSNQLLFLTENIYRADNTTYFYRNRIQSSSQMITFDKNRYFNVINFALLHFKKS